MRVGNNFKNKIKKVSIGISSFKELLLARIISPRLNIKPDDAKSLGKDLFAKLGKIKNTSDLYEAANELASIRFGENFNIPVDSSMLIRNEDEILTVEELGLELEECENFNIPYGIIAILGGPDSGKTSLLSFVKERFIDYEMIVAMEPILNSDEQFLIGPTASCLGLVASLHLESNLIFYDSARFVRGVSDYGLGEKGLPIGVSLFLTDINNLLVYCRKRMLLVVSTESNNDGYNQAYYELLRGAVNGIIQPIAGSQAGYIECKPANRNPKLYHYGSKERFDTVSNIFELKTNFKIKEASNE